MVKSKNYKEYLEAQKPGPLILTEADTKRMDRMGERYKALFSSREGVTYYRFFYTLEEFAEFVKMCRKFKSSLVAYATSGKPEITV